MVVMFIATMIILAVPIGGIRWFLLVDIFLTYLAWKNDNHTGSLFILAVMFNIAVLILLMLMVVMACIAIYR